MGDLPQPKPTENILHTYIIGFFSTKLLVLRKKKGVIGQKPMKALQLFF